MASICFITKMVKIKHNTPSCYVTTYSRINWLFSLKNEAVDKMPSLLTEDGDDDKVHYCNIKCRLHSRVEKAAFACFPMVECRFSAAAEVTSSMPLAAWDKLCEFSGRLIRRKASRFDRALRSKKSRDVLCLKSLRLSSLQKLTRPFGYSPARGGRSAPTTAHSFAPPCFTKDPARESI